jgi:hypothetical protein
VFAPGQGNFTSAQSVTITAQSGVIHYTTDGSTATTSSPVYNGPISVTGSANIAAIASDVSGYAPSPSVRQTYAIFPVTPFISPAPGTYTSGRTISISDSTPGSVIYYTIDGSTPTVNSALYTSPISIPSTPGSETVRCCQHPRFFRLGAATLPFNTSPFPRPLPVA